MKVPKIALLFVIAVLGWWMFKEGKESFYNIVPTEVIDPEFVSPNLDPWSYTTQSGGTYQRVGDLYGVDLNCNNVTIPDLVGWIADNNPHLLHQYVLRYDPSINIYNPNHSPRILKGLLRNLPTQHKFLPIIRKCFPAHIRV
jgi:hypothetical protein